MGIVNVTPDSFSDGGRLPDAAAAVAHGLQLVAQGADLLDIGGESTRPGARPVSVAEELDRVLPVIEGLRGCGVPLSIDTRKPEVMRAVLAAGADMINDIGGFTDPAAVDAVSAGTCGLCVMHMKGEPQTMQQAPEYADVVAEVRDFLQRRVAALTDAGIGIERLCLDPGIGFGKSMAHNIELLRRLNALAVRGLPVLVGLSRKSLVGGLTGRPVNERLAGSLGGAIAAVARGAAILRVHDVAATCDALTVWRTIATDGAVD